MATNDIDIFQDFCKKWINKAVNKHFKDVEGTSDASLSLGAARQAIKRVCLHKDDDNMPLTIGRLLIWWVEARGLFEDVIYGIPSTDFEIKYTYYPQIKLHFSESRYESSNNNRRPVRTEVSFRWRDDNYSEASLTAIATKIKNTFAVPVFKYGKGRNCWTYWDDQKGYRFTVYAQSEVEAKKIIGAAISLQDTETPDWDNKLREHKDGVNYTTQKTVRVLGKTEKSPKKRPVGTVEFQYAEMFIPGTTKPIILVDRTGYRPLALKPV